MTAEQRRAEILNSLNSSAPVSVRDLARTFATSEVTIRRDLADMEEMGLLRRTRGGAVSAQLRGDEKPFAMRELEYADEKDRIAREAVSLLSSGEALVIDGGTTTYPVARLLRDLTLTVMPLAANLVEPLTSRPELTVLMPGGLVRRGESSVIGPLTEHALAALHFDTFFIGCCGLSVATGATAYDLQDAAVKHAAIRSAARTVALIDSSKFSRTALARVCPIEDIDIVITDTGAPTDVVDDLRRRGIEVRVV
ncbi:DeoR/GlpR family DNA-binding transcription regulator [Gordonia sp. CPCC 205515]|uniref:DeoR/GlpR family DNA-binding transcription regulator n=1 Tax=Gordonia sp. CPCC 205515 TaxID=3140791 RepID=UPI003AF3F0CD